MIVNNRGIDAITESIGREDMRTKKGSERKPRQRWHERTADKDIRYRGPLNYQHFQILGWLCTLWAMRNCKLDKHEMVEVQKRIEEKKNELKEAEANA